MNANTSLNSQLKSAVLTLNRPRNAMSFILGRVSALFCASFILLVGAFCISNSVVSTRTASLPGKIAGEIVGSIIVHLLCLLLTIYCGVAFGRCLLRVRPPQLLGRVRLAPLLLTIPSILVCAVLSFALLLLRRANSGAPQQVGSAALIMASFVFYHLVWWGAVAASLLIRHLKPRAFLDRPFVLFLRRFSKFSDREMIRLVLSQTSPDVPVVFLTPTRTRSGDWNPFLVAFAGMKLRHPFRSIPITLRSPDDQWEQAAELLIRHAQRIMFDISEGSGAIDAEFEMISQAARWPYVICLKEGAATADSEFEQTIKSKGVQVVSYRKSWVRALPRLLLGFIITTLNPALMPIALAGRLITNPTLNALFLFFQLLCWGWLYASFFVRPAVDRASKSSLRMVLWGEK